ncbi:MAG: TonB-dependent receptor [candidate division KSB1 bacterium]|nr:TonB-dependent receptor [candidate division KSB1 bacterium]MDZ7273421.1 TonB-dependent receptor [candidate division KSB1 bacterium]MDZ7286986.1 TonB-dependent receptor [candidate division KSB1 bacterium]MDZ7299661.1 TonB-dependent receptor [candidate division KSB1 bacterium]MDZ7308293.1 TonB-dependent receptor [candidate division KSB1 bacterium]
MKCDAIRLGRAGAWWWFGLCALLLVTSRVQGQGVTTAAMSGIVTDSQGQPLPGAAAVIAIHEPSGTHYGTATRSGGAFNIPNMKVGGPYTVTVSLIGFKPQKRENIHLNLGQTVSLEFKLVEEALTMEGIEVSAEQDEVLNRDRTGAATFIKPAQVVVLPSVKRSTRDLTRLDPRSDGNFSFGGRNWLYNNISLDGSYFNNPFGLDDPAPGGQTNAEPVPYDAVEQVQVSIAPFDVREGGFTGAGINTVTKSGSNEFKASVYSFVRNENLLGNKVRGRKVIANPDLAFNQSGFTVSGPLVKNKLFFFLNGELERRDDPGTNFVANRGTAGFGVSRVQAAVMDQIRQRMISVYNYDPGAYDGFIHETDNNKLLAKLDWNINDNHTATFRYNLLDAVRDLPPHPFVLSFNNTGRGPNEASLPFQNSGYAINNELHSFAFELNSRSNKLANRFFASYNRFRDFRQPFSPDFPTIEIGEAGVTYTTVGHEPFSIHNILDQDVLQFTNNLSLFSGRHVFTVGANFEYFSFFNSFNIFRHGVFFLPPATGIGTTFSSLEEFFALTDPNRPGGPFNFRGLIGKGPFKGENIDVGQLGLYAQDEFQVSPLFNLTYGLRVDFPMYFTDPVDNPFSRGLRALDEKGNPEIVDQSKLPGATPLFSPRVGFNWDVRGDRSLQVRGGTGIFTGRVPFVWIGNVISNPGANPNLYPAITNVPQAHKTSDDAILQQSFDLNAMDPDFKFPQVWVTNLAIDKQLPGDLLGTLEVVYGNDLNAVFMRNADLVAPRRFLRDGRPYYGGFGANELNPDGGAGIYVIDNTSDGYNLNVTAQLRKSFRNGLNTSLAYSFTQAKNQLKSTEIASVLWQNQPVQGNPNLPELSYSEFGQRHRIVGSATYRKSWSGSLATHAGLFLEVAEGNRFAGSGGNRYSYIYSGDVNGDGQGGNDLIYIPRDQNDINLAAYTDGSGRTISAQEQWHALDAFITQDKYLSRHRGEIAERFGAVNPWYYNIDLRVLQDFSFTAGARRQTIQLSLDILNLPNLINSSWGVRKVASAAATSPLRLAGFDNQGEPIFNFVGPSETFIDDAGLNSRWQIQVGLRYLFN